MSRPPAWRRSLTDAALLPSLYRTEQNNGWSIGMRAITRALIVTETLPRGPVAELGCGGGRLLAELGLMLPGRILTGIDLHPQALGHAAATLSDAALLAQAHLHQLPWPADTFALVLALDTLDQRRVQLSKALRESWRILCPGGILLLRVSAHPWLQGPHDAAFNTGRRYAKRTVLQALLRTGFAPVRVTYANALFGAPIAVLRLLQRWRVLPFLPALYTTPGVNALLAAALRQEARWLRRVNLPAGLSLYALAQKPAPARDAGSPPAENLLKSDEPTC